MAQLRRGRNQPLPYVLKSIKQESGGQYVQHAVTYCCDCDAVHTHIWTKPENPMMIARIFERAGWVLYQSKARCPDCTRSRMARQADWNHRQLEEEKIFTPEEPLPLPLPPMDDRQMADAINDLLEGNMQTMRLPNKPIEVPATPLPPKQVYLLTIEHGRQPVITAVVNAREMLFGDEAFLVIPRT